MTNTLYETRETENSGSPAQPQAFKRFPIRVLSERTGVGSSTLRAWERRYGLITPERTPKGHRLYSEMDVARIERVLTLLNEGHALPQMRELIDQPSTHQPAAHQSHWPERRQRMLDAIQDFSVERLESFYLDTTALYPIDLITEQLIEPVLVQMGKSWRGRSGGIAEEHFFSGWLRNRLGQEFNRLYNQARGPRLTLACLPGTHHEIGLLLFAVSALTRGYRVIYFGANLPIKELPHILARSASRGVIFSAHNGISKHVDEQLGELMQNLQLPVFIGGPNINSFDAERFCHAGGIMLGERISVALKVLASHIPPQPIPGDRRRNAHKTDE